MTIWPIRLVSGPSLHERSMNFIAQVGRLGACNNCETRPHSHSVYLYIDIDIYRLFITIIALIQ